MHFLEILFCLQNNPSAKKLETGERYVNPVTMSILALTADKCHLLCKDKDQFPNAIGLQFFLQGGQIKL